MIDSFSGDFKGFTKQIWGRSKASILYKKYNSYDNCLLKKIASKHTLNITDQNTWLSQILKRIWVYEIKERENSTTSIGNTFVRKDSALLATFGGFLRRLDSRNFFQNFHSRKLDLKTLSESSESPNIERLFIQIFIAVLLQRAESLTLVLWVCIVSSYH